MIGRCLFCSVDLDKLAAEGKVGHVCSQKPTDHADGSAYQCETDFDPCDDPKHDELRAALADAIRELEFTARNNHHETPREKLDAWRKLVKP